MDIEARQTARVRRLTEMAHREAERLGVHYIGTEHILLALLRDKDSQASRILNRFGVTIERVE